MSGIRSRPPRAARSTSALSLALLDSPTAADIEMSVTGLHLNRAADDVELPVLSHFQRLLTVSNWPVRRTNLDAVAFVVFQSVRASMLARMLESPRGVDHESLTEELTCGQT